MARHNAKHHKRKQSAARHSIVKPAAPAAEVERLRRNIQLSLQQAKQGVLTEQALFLKCRGKRHTAAYHAALEALQKEGLLIRQRNGFALNDTSDCFQAKTIRLARSFGFIQDEEGTEYFVPGKYLQGSMPGDLVLARSIPSRTDSPEAKVISVTREAEQVQMTGVIIPTEEGLQLLPDSMGHTPMRLEYKESVAYTIGDKVLAVLTKRGSRHSEHRVRAILNFGSAERAEHCVSAHIAEQQIPVEFPEEVLREAHKASLIGVTAFDLQGRQDFRRDCVFTIDGAYSKDLDDAVSVRSLPEGGWELGVHIADVSHYVRANSPLDAQAFERGTSIYYADKVIPMLPPDLSNGICSLNPGENRLTLSAVMRISPEGDLLEAKFCKSVICSAVRGVYSECNAILDGTADAALQEKYTPVTESLHLLDALAKQLEVRRNRRGAVSLESTESALLLDAEGICTGLAPVQRGRSEEIIEACMLAANEAAARLAREQKLPFLYRVHEEPSAERLAHLRETMEKLGAEIPHFSPEVRPVEIQALLDGHREEPYFPILNSMTLRSMAKAKYSHEPLGHFGLALRDYTHFTSPIRRYPDLVVHRILSDYLDGGSAEWMQRRYRKFTENAALHASDMEVRAVALERVAQACYAAEFMQGHIGETFSGWISGVTEHGVYVTLDNMVEAMVHIEDLPEGSYELEPDWYVKSEQHRFAIGDAVQVVCLKADVNTGKVLAALNP